MLRHIPCTVCLYARSLNSFAAPVNGGLFNREGGEMMRAVYVDGGGCDDIPVYRVQPKGLNCQCWAHHGVVAIQYVTSLGMKKRTSDPKPTDTQTAETWAGLQNATRR
ncbi:hypothetical protein BaRGS_00006258 [Batillaria attramentaria]|uniref:Uncharacterized protein n=1 Tax=Batillaria attramentaria TaxID=370345 RepID=A0ABD0LSP3_9CAEN